MKFMLFLTCCFLFSCTEKRKQHETALLPTEIKQPVMLSYMKILPAILNKSKEFRSLDHVQNLSDDEFHQQFFTELFNDSSISLLLKQIGFSDKEEFAKFHSQVVYNYLIIYDIESGKIKNGNEILSNIPNHISLLDQQLSALLLQKGRERNNKSLKEEIKNIEEQLISLKNLVIVQFFYLDLKVLNEL